MIILELKFMDRTFAPTFDAPNLLQLRWQQPAVQFNWYTRFSQQDPSLKSHSQFLRFCVQSRAVQKLNVLGSDGGWHMAQGRLHFSSYLEC